MGLKPEILDGLLAYGFEEPRRVQQWGIVPILSGRDAVTLADCDTGKTATYLIPLLQRLNLSADAPSSPQLLVLTPTREMCLLALRILQGIGAKLGVKAVSLVGGLAVSEHEEALRRGCHVVIGTPGRVCHMMKMGALDMTGLIAVVVEEADEMLSQGFSEPLQEVLPACSRWIQFVFTSTALPRNVLDWVNSYVKDPFRTPFYSVWMPGSIRRYKAWVPDDDQKARTIGGLLLLPFPGKCVILCNTAPRARTLSEKLLAGGHAVGCIHGDMDQSERSDVMGRFSRGALRILVARSTVIPRIRERDVSLVISYDMPRNAGVHVGLIRSWIPQPCRVNTVYLFLFSDQERELLESISETLHLTMPDLPEDISSLFGRVRR